METKKIDSQSAFNHVTRKTKFVYIASGTVESPFHGPSNVCIYPGNPMLYEIGLPKYGTVSDVKIALAALGSSLQCVCMCVCL
jgi:hypothetical protein